MKEFKQIFFWPGLLKSVTHLCQSCDICQKTVPVGSVPRALLKGMPLVDQPFMRVAIGQVGPNAPAFDKRALVHFDLSGLCYKVSRSLPLNC